MLDCIAADRRLPKIMAMDAMAAEGRTYEALVRVLSRRGSTPCILQQSRRPKLQSALDGKAYLEKALSSSTRKKLRQHRRRLSEKGAVTSVVASEPEAVRRAFEDFLTLEASGWKGREGTALLSDKADAAFMVAADFDAYWAAQRAVDALYDKPGWWRSAILNTARMAYFSSDRAVREYAQDIWRVPLI